MISPADLERNLKLVKKLNELAAEGARHQASLAATTKAEPPKGKKRGFFGFRFPFIKTGRS